MIFTLMIEVDDDKQEVEYELVESVGDKLWLTPEPGIEIEAKLLEVRKADQLGALT